MNIELDDNILTKFIAGECSDLERKEIELQLENNNDVKQRLVQLEKVWSASKKELFYQNPEDAWNKFVLKADIDYAVNTKESIPIKTFYSNYFVRYAAVILILILPLYLVLDLMNSSDLELINVEVNYGERKKVTLADGTIITLDSGSKLSYPKKFNSFREVKLNGEAYFEVTRDIEKPFVVSANQGKIKVLGTKFNIRSWKEINKVEVAVTEGKVSLFNMLNDADTAYLTKGNFSQIDSSIVPTQPKLISENEITGWMNREKYFEDTPLSEILAQLERWYNIDIELTHKSALNQILSIHIRNSTYKANLDLISLVTGLTVKYEKDRIILN